METLNLFTVKRPSLVQYAIGPLLLVTGLGIILHMKWLELQLIFRSYFQFGNHSRGQVLTPVDMYWHTCETQNLTDMHFLTRATARPHRMWLQF